MNGIIDILSDDLSNRLAAGEVVERPASVVKELVENSIDSGADDIAIEILGGGKRLISVTDNGSGMVRDDAVLSLQRHATSKIKNEDDIFSIRTLGFRGEALPSIASVSKMIMLTACKGEEAGTNLRIESGKIIDVKDAPPLKGTSLQISNLFYNVPARQKFLKSDTTEFSHIQTAVVRLALANPTINFKLLNQQRALFELSSSDKFIDRISGLFGEELAGNLIEIKASNSEMSLTGFVSKPGYSRSTKENQYLYLNKRYIKDRIINHAVYEAFKTLIPKDRHPIYFLCLDLDPTSVDVNVHPTKLEVRFSNGQLIHSFLLNSIRKVLEEKLAPIVDSGNAKEQSIPMDTGTTLKGFRPYTDTKKSTREVNHDDRNRRVKEAISKYISTNDPATYRSENPATQIGSKRETYRAGFESAAIKRKTEELKAELKQPMTSANYETTELKLCLETGATLSRMKPVGQLYNTFVVIEGEDKILIVDQHTAHERILYEKLVEKVNKGRLDVQELLFPVQIELSYPETSLIQPYLDDFAKLGFQLEPFGKNTFQLRSVPLILANDDPKKAVFDLIDAISEKGKSNTMEEVLDRMIMAASCRGAIKAGQGLDMKEMESLMQNLDKAKLPFTCPHGRPIVLSIDKNQILKGFLRK